MWGGERLQLIAVACADLALLQAEFRLGHAQIVEDRLSASALDMVEGGCEGRGGGGTSPQSESLENGLWRLREQGGELA